MNKVILLGNLTRDPEQREISSGSNVTSFSIAVNRKYKSKDGETKEETTFVDCSVWGPFAAICAKYLEKGSKVLVEGRLRTESWEDKETKAKRSKLSVVCDTVEFLSAKGESDSAPAKSKKKPAAASEDFDEEDSPF